MDAGLAVPVSLVSAPAGYGKSMLLSLWAKSLDRKCAWVSLDRGDNNVHLFLRYFLAAIRTIFPVCCERTGSILQRPTLPPIQTVVGILINEISELERPFVLVLDDYHLVSNEDVHEVIRVFIDHPLTNMHLVIATRRDPSLPLASLSGLGKINQVRLEHLEFTLEETAELINQSLSTPVSKEALVNAHASVEGWAVGLRLALLALSSKEDAEVFLRGLGRGFNPMQQFLFNEVLSALDPSLKEWLMKASILDRYCASLCEAVCGTGELPESDSSQGQEFIDELIRRNLFCLHLDNEGKWFRFHHQFQVLLKERLVSAFPRQEIDSLYGKASIWFEQQGLIDEALKYSVEINDQSRAALLVLRHGGELIMQERCSRMEAWLQLLEQETIQNDPRLLVLVTWTHHFRLQMDDWKIALDQAQARIDEMSLDPVEQDKHLGLLDAIRSSYFYLTSNLDEAIDCANRAMDKVPSEYQRLRVHAINVLGLCYQASGRHEELQDFLEGIMTAPENQEPEIQLLLLTLSCTIKWLECRIAQMQPDVFRLHKLSHDSAVPQHKGWAGTYQAMCAYWRNDLDVVEQRLDSSQLKASALHAITYQDESAILTLTHLARGRPHEALKVADCLSDFGLEIGNASMFNLGQALGAEIAIRSASPARAEQWAANYTERELNIQFACYEPELTLVKVFIFQNTDDSLERGLRVLSKIERHARSTYFRSLLVKVLCYKSILLDRLNQTQDAVQALEEAVTEAAPGGGTRFFLDAGQSIAQLLGHIETHEHEAFVRHLLNEFKAENSQLTGKSAEAGQGPGDRLSPTSILTTRELDVLSLLARRLRDKQIASELFISTETVKSHLKHIFQKLEVHNRRQAVTRARALGVLSPDD
jgi:LuxR family maltose regulon positive regulatory protein